MKRAERPLARQGGQAPGHPEAPERGDPELMAAVAVGDLGALGVLYDRYHETTREFLSRAAPDPADAEDLVQETFLTLLQAAGSYDGRARAAGFIIGVAVHLLRRRRRFLGRWAEILWEVQDLCGAVVATPEDNARATEDLAAVDRALARMSEAKRLVYLMVEREGLSGEEVAALLGVPIGTVWTRLHHARAALQRALLKRGGAMKTWTCSMAPLIEAQRDGRLGHREIASLERHLGTCASCAATAQRLGRIAAHVRSPRVPSTELSHQRGRLALLRAAAQGRPRSPVYDAGSAPGPRLTMGAQPPNPRRRTVWGAVALAALALAAMAAAALRSPAQVVALARRIPPPCVPAARTETIVRASEGARFERLVSLPDPGRGAPQTSATERIQLQDGSLDLEVRRLLPTERFLVTTADAEVEVRGTVFRVEAADGHIVRVSVREGKVEVRHRGASSLVPAGAEWRPRAPTSDLAEVVPSSPPLRGPRPAPAARAGAAAVSTITALESPKPEARASASKEFAEDVALIERGDYAKAADRLEAFRAAHPRDARAEDADYLAILSLQRAGRAEAAARAARRYLAIHPQSARRGAVERVVDGVGDHDPHPTPQAPAAP